MPSDPRAETELRAAAQPVASDRLDQALRVLGSGLAGRPAGTVPDIVGVWLDGETVHLLLTKPCAMPPTPWVSDGTRWTLPAEAVLPPVEGLLAALPALATVGSQPGTHLLLDLERLGTLTLVGDPARCADLLRYLAAELASNTWSDHVDVMLAGFDAEEVGVFAALSGGERIEVVPSAAEGIAGLRRRVAEVVGNVSHRGATDALDGRLNDTAADGWTPYVLLAADCGPDDLNSLDALDTELAAAGRCAAAVVIASDRNAGRWTLQIATDGRLDVPFLGIQADDGELTAASLPRIELSALAELLATADRGLDSSASTKPPTAPDSALHLTEGDGLFAPPRGEAPSNQATEQDRNASANAEAASDPVWDGRKPPVADASAMANEVSTQRSAVPRNPDDTLDGDLAAWLGADPTRPRIGILGPVSLEAPGTQPRQRQRFHAEVAVYLAGCGSRGATPDRLDDALWPNRVIEPAARRVAITRTRTWLGKAPGGEKWLPELDSERRYRLRDGYLLDWHLFRRLRARAEGKGPDGVADLRAALSLVRGAPLAGADVAFSSNARNPYPWLTTSDLAPMHLVSAIVDTAHHLVDFCLAAGDLREARWAADQAWVADVDRDSDIPWRDHLRIAAAAGNEAELEHLLGSLMSEREAEVPEDLDRVTYQLLCEVMPDRMGVAGR
ncbi:hypothetical protein SAMN05443668_103563 [Cryptosporangium aurantiacum]|uniref:Bacterial transcriptional activator domain-containing protein n=2 Tax=Cryptosporangium aurantiacum TaxID=134849 RepID=A0A1M7PPQ3_9ACTN|nr:hypothetical protein SAMN05443668_103563 [Cryptosporangium aurantiacum]